MSFDPTLARKHLAALLPREGAASILSYAERMRGGDIECALLDAADGCCGADAYSLAVERKIGRRQNSASEKINSDRQKEDREAALNIYLLRQQALGELASLSVMTEEQVKRFPHIRWSAYVSAPNGTPSAAVVRTGYSTESDGYNDYQSPYGVCVDVEAITGEHLALIREIAAEQSA